LSEKYNSAAEKKQAVFEEKYSLPERPKAGIITGGRENPAV
jgi:hypothetical protein